MLAFPRPWRLHMNFDFDWPSGFGEDVLTRKMPNGIMDWFFKRSMKR